MNHHTSDSPTLPSRTVATPAGPALISPDQEARAFWRMRRQIVRTLVAQTFAQGRLRISTIVFLSMFLWFALYALFYDGFRFLDSAIPGPDLYDQIARMVFGLFFASLMVMLLFSTAIILYSSLFRARDVPFLLTIPARAERVFIVKFQEAVLTSSWAFILLSSPVLLAYGLVRHAPWYYFAMLLPFLVSFTFIPAGIGAILCLAIVHRLPHAKAYVLVITAAWRARHGGGHAVDHQPPSGHHHALGRLVPRHAPPAAVHRKPLAAELVVEHRAVGSRAG